MRLRTSKLQSENGQSAVEFALILPILILLLLGIIEFGWFFNAKITITSAAREGVRVYAINGESGKGSGGPIEMAIKNATNSLILDGGIAFTTSGPAELTVGSGVQMVTVNVTGKVKSLVGFIVPGGITMSSEASMRAEYFIAQGGSRYEIME
jgi:Flp pilus assembly protein TadG